MYKLQIPYQNIKRFFDICFALLSIVFLFPIFLVIVLMNYIFLGTPIFFNQKRPGYKNKIFKIYKFRTMNNNKDKNGILLGDKKRLTPYGIFLRKTSFDELPTLYNVLNGDMSFVGPRPLLVRYLERYSHRQIKRHNVKPGITGLAQINGRNLLSWPEKLEFDVIYIEKISFIFDLEILIKTFFIVIRRTGISSRDSATAKEFKREKKDS